MSASYGSAPGAASAAAGEAPRGVHRACDPRVARSRHKILESTLAELAERGYETLTIEGIAERAGVAKSTVYRHWDGKGSLVMDALTRLRAPVTIAATGNLRADLVAVASALVAALASDDLPFLVRTLMEAADRDPELARLHQVFVADRRDAARALVLGAIECGELPATTDLDQATDLVIGPLLYRALVLRDTLDPVLVARNVETVLRGLGYQEGTPSREVR